MNFLNQGDPLLVIIGPSGSGKSSVIQELTKRDIIEVTPSWTTRPPRANEKDLSVEHKFVSEQEFTEHEKRGYFIEVVKMFGLPYRYGLPKILYPQPKHIPLIMLRANLLPLLAKHYTNTTVYQIEDDVIKIAARLQVRQADGEQQGSRLDDYEKEVALGKKSAHRVFQNTSSIPSLASEIQKVIKEDFDL